MFLDDVLRLNVEEIVLFINLYIIWLLRLVFGFVVCK